tara:strand:- start:10501 stop:10983 length:483 start_codon:yes stop_codon:yes gene_type:complete
LHPGGPASLKVDQGVPDKGDLRWGHLHPLRNLKGTGGVRFAGEGVLLAQDHGPGDPVEHPGHDLDGVVVWLVGTDGEGQTFVVQVLQHLPDAGVKVRAFPPAFLIGREKVLVDLLHQFIGGGSADSASHQHTAAITHKALHPCGGMGWESVGGEGTVETS